MPVSSSRYEYSSDFRSCEWWFMCDLKLMILGYVILQPKWNNALLEMFQIDYIGKSPYINCLPSLYHHRLGSKDRFLILSSDGLYQYFTNEEAVSEVELFITLQPEGDPAQHLVQELLFRAAKKAGTVNILSFCFCSIIDFSLS